MACSQTLAGIARDCEPSMGGVRRVLIANYDDVSATPTISEGVITEITLAEGKKFHEYIFRPGTAHLDSVLNKDNAAGTAYYTSQVSLQFSRLESAKRMEMVALTAGYFVAIVEDNNGKYWYLGFDEPMSASAGTAATGTARADLNGYTLVLDDNSRELPYEVNADIVAGLVAGLMA